MGGPFISKGDGIFQKYYFRWDGIFRGTSYHVIDHCEADDGKLATTCSRKPQFQTRFSEALHAAKPFFFFVASLLK